MTERNSTGSDQSAEQRAAGSPAAAAARRARRIGGRVGAQGAGPEPTSGAGAPASLTKPAPARPAPSTEPAKAARPARPAKVPPTGTERVRNAGPPSTPAWLNWLPAAVLAVGAAVMAVLLIVFSHGVWWGPDAGAVPTGKAATATRDQVLAAAKTCGAALNTYSYKDLDAFSRHARACTTGQFTSQFQDAINNTIRTKAPQLKASQSATITHGGIEAVSPDGDQWTIILYATLSVTNSGSTTPESQPFAAQLIMQRVGTKWLVANETTVSNPQ
jgi:hypothetical protein